VDSHLWWICMHLIIHSSSRLLTAQNIVKKWIQNSITWSLQMGTYYLEKRHFLTLAGANENGVSTSVFSLFYLLKQNILF
jgi:hypothetical protein